MKTNCTSHEESEFSLPSAFVAKQYSTQYEWILTRERQITSLLTNRFNTVFVLFH